MIRIVAGAAVAETDVEKTVRPEGEVPAIVVGERLLDDRRPANAIPPEIESRRRVRDERIGRAAEARDDGVAVGPREVDVKAPGQAGIGREGEAEQPLLAAGPEVYIPLF